MAGSGCWEGGRRKRSVDAGGRGRDGPGNGAGVISLSLTVIIVSC